MPEAMSPCLPVSHPSRGRFQALVEMNQRVCRDHFRLRLRVEDADGTFPHTHPGQFIQLGCQTPAQHSEPAEPTPLLTELEWQADKPLAGVQAELRAPTALLRRPFSLAGRGDDGQGSWLEIVHRVVGVGTGWLAALQPGDRVDFIGPLGNQFTLPAGKRRGFLVGGGVGLPPMFYLAQTLAQAGWAATAFMGAQTADLLAVSFTAAVPDRRGLPTLCVRPFADASIPSVVTTDDGSLGLPGLITTGLQRFVDTLDDAQRGETVAFICGPVPMMRAASRIAIDAGIATQVCMEQAMACGMGTCQSCIVRVEDRQNPQGTTPQPDARPWRYRLCCTDGPVFDGHQIVW